MRIADPYHLGPLIGSRRRELGMTQADVCAAARVSRRWLSGLEGGKVTAEVGLVFRVLAVLKLTVDIAPEQPVPGRPAAGARQRSGLGPDQGHPG
jgi:HTH-type transcriptional regulator / antitoxin HipB